MGGEAIYHSSVDLCFVIYIFHAHENFPQKILCTSGNTLCTKGDDSNSINMRVFAPFTLQGATAVDYSGADLNSRLKACASPDVTVQNVFYLTGITACNITSSTLPGKPLAEHSLEPVCCTTLCSCMCDMYFFGPLWISCFAA